VRGPGRFESIAASEIGSAISIAGIAVRYGFYAVGALVLGLIGMTILSLQKVVPTVVDTAPSFRIASDALAGLPVSGHVVSSSVFGRAEVRQYGTLHNRTTDFAIVVVMPPATFTMGTQFAQDLREVNLLRNTRAIMLSINYDLETRFGEFRATEMQVDTDGRLKQCLAFRSRLDSAAVYLTGWFCDGTGSKPSANTLACILDKLVLDKDLASAEANAFMRDRIARTARCRADTVSQTTDTGYRRGVSPPSRWTQPSATRRY
jgi:hypothetical protein